MARPSRPLREVLALLLSAASPALAQQDFAPWPGFRGPSWTGASPDGDPPVHWSEERNVRFKVPLPGPGLASPVVWGDRIFVLSTRAQDRAAYAASRGAAQEVADARGWPPRVAPVRQGFLVEAYSRRDGSLEWRRVAAERVPHESHYLDSSWACASPLTDGERLYAHFGSNGTYAYSLDGEALWQVDLGDMTTRNGFGEGSSPALHGDLLVINWDHEGDSFLVALDRRTGEERWRVARPGEITSWTTPLVVERDGRAQVVVAATGRSRGYDLETGEEIWNLGGMTVNAIPTPVHAAGIVYLTSGYRGSLLQAVSLAAARGAIGGSAAVLWTHDRDTPYVASPLLYRGQLYFVKHFGNILTSLDAVTGELHYTKRLPGIRSVYASPVAAAGRVYLFGREGEALVLEHGAELDVLAHNSLDDGFDATPAIVGREIYLRGRRSLYALAHTAEE